ncbi:MAG: lipid transporter ATP-binding/permease [Gammaproteobacteria bacterium SG8_15]|nr:MAG: lipid transporter ATP-binding/permease [Gammaproteobacteria bacterium SG8_15]
MPDLKSQDTDFKIVKRYLRYMTPYVSGFILAIFGMALTAATETSLAAILKPLLDEGFVEKDPEIIKLIPFALMGIALLRGVGGFLSSYYMAWISRSVVRDMRAQIYSHLIDLPTRYFDKNSSGHLMSKLIYDVEQVANASASAITVIVRDTLTLIGLLAWMLYLNWKLTLIFFAVAPIISLLVVFVSKRFRKLSRRIQHSMGNVTQATQQIVHGQRIIKIFDGRKQEIDSFSQVNEHNRKQHLKLAATASANVPINQFLAAVALAFIIYIATSGTLMSAPSVGDFASFITAAMLLLPPLKRLNQVVENWQRGMAAAQSVFDLLDEVPEVDQGTTEVKRVNGEIEYRNVTFNYSNERHAALKDISFKAHAGQTVAIVGRSGSGKSTLVNLLPRFYDLQQGTISIDGVPIQDFKLANLRRQIALVSQEVTLFNDTVANNIAYGSTKDATREEIIHAAETAHAMEFINELPDGVNTMIGDKGMLISGGQRQRIAIARAVLKDAPILILDEATSALDTQSERYIQDALEILMKGRTTLVIAHRLSTIEKADKIIVMHDGEIVEEGNHSGLIAADGHYAALHKMQFREAANG